MPRQARIVMPGKLQNNAEQFEGLTNEAVKNSHGVDLLTVKELSGHKSIEMTLRYSHLSGEHKAKAVQELDKI